MENHVWLQIQGTFFKDTTEKKRGDTDEERPPKGFLKHYLKILDTCVCTYKIARMMERVKFRQLFDCFLESLLYRYLSFFMF